MRRRDFITVMSGMAATWPVAAARAQSNVVTLRLTYVWLGEPGTDDSTLKGLRRGLRDLGYVEGKNFQFEFYYARSSNERLDALLADIVKEGKTDILITPGTTVTLAAQKATKTIPVVSATGDPIGAGVVASIAHPGGKITGCTLTTGPEIGEKWLELLHEAFPKRSRAAVLWNSSSVYSAALIEKLKAAASRLGISILSNEVRQPSDFAGAFKTITNEKADAIVTDLDPLLIAHRTEIVEFAAKERLPGVYGVRDMVDSGGLMSYGASTFDLSQKAASYVDRIAKGAEPGDLPIQQPTKFELIVNLKTARALGLTIPGTVTARADEVIE
jgi:putative ABC transport system substrate-binding protein